MIFSGINASPTDNIMHGMNHIDNTHVIYAIIFLWRVTL